MACRETLTLQTPEIRQDGSSPGSALDCSTDLCVVVSNGTYLCFQLDARWEVRGLFFLVFCFFFFYSRAGSTTAVDRVTDPWLQYCGVGMIWGFSSILEIRLLHEHWTVHNLELC